MSDATTTHSTRFRRAAIAECERLLRRQSRAAERVSSLEEELSKAKKELIEILNRVEKLRALTGDVASRPIEVAPQALGTPISGAEIRKVAVRLLRASENVEQPIHYRRWLELVEEAGYLVRGKRPEAVFLGQIVRSPVVQSTTQAGYYALDEEAPERLREQIIALEETSQETLVSSPDAPAEIDKHIAREKERSAQVRRVQKALREALESLGEAVAPTDRAAA
jgi:hypothetical protein